MKNLFGLFFFLILLSSCQKEDLIEAKVDSYPQTWQLVRMSGSLPVFTKTGTDLPWQETYVFQADSTFTKTRQKGDQLVEASGTFSTRNDITDLYLTLTYATDNDLINNCSATPKEALLLKADATLISSSEACDGPRFEYKPSK